MAGLHLGVLWATSRRGLELVRSPLEFAVERPTSLPAKGAACIISLETS